MDDYKPNSHKSKEEAKELVPKKKVEKVIKGTAKVHKKSKASKITGALISEDASNVKTYIVSDVLIPAVKKLVCDIVKDGIEMILYGGSTGGRKSSSRVDYVSYNRYSDRRDTNRYDRGSYRRAYSYDDVTVDTRGEAEHVLTCMDELIETYGYVSVADLYDLVGITGNYTDNKYGWTNIRNAEPVRVRDGYMLKLPKVTPINS